MTSRQAKLQEDTAVSRTKCNTLIRCRHGLTLPLALRGRARLHHADDRPMAQAAPDRLPATASTPLNQPRSPSQYHHDCHLRCDSRRASGQTATAIAARLRKLQPHTAAFLVVTELLRQGWSPQQIQGRLRERYPDDPAYNVSHETIYTAIYATPRGELRKELIRCLRQSHDGRRKRSQGEDRRGSLPDMVSIHERPSEVEDRLIHRYWEADLIKGAGNRSAVATLVERSSRLVMLAKMPDASAASALEALTAMLNCIPEPALRQTLTYDQGREMSRHKELTEHTGGFSLPTRTAPSSVVAMRTPTA